MDALERTGVFGPPAPEPVRAWNDPAADDENDGWADDFIALERERNRGGEVQ